MNDMKFMIPSVLALFLSLLCSCGEPEEGKTAVSGNIGIEPAEISVNAEAQDVTLTVTANYDWGVTAEDSWVKTVPSGGIKGESELKVSISANKSFDTRETTLLFRSGKGRFEVPVHQHYMVEAVTFDDEALMQALLKVLDADNDGILSTVEIIEVTELDLSSAGISNIAGLADHFPELVSLDLSDNSLTSIDITMFPALTTLDLSANPDLTAIYVWTGFSVPEGFNIPEGVTLVEPEIPTPAGYRLVWYDEFNDNALIMPDAGEWWYEVAKPGWVNNELQTYVAGRDGETITAEVSSGSLKIHLIEKDGKYLSARVNTKDSWTYGYFEARLKLPKGLGTWPAFWMMPVSGGETWPKCGEIDIMEHVGADLNQVSSSIHCQAYYHAINTQKTAAKYLEGATDEFHVYALEWTPEFIRSFVDGKQLFYYNPDDYALGRNADTWPFDKPFQLKLNLAWGGDWGGYKGVNYDCLPQTYEIDYVRVFQKP